MKQLLGNTRNTMQQRIAQKVTTGFAALTMVLAVSAGTAWSFDTYDSVYGHAATQVEDSGSVPFVSTVPSPSVADSCLPLLKSIHSTNSVSAMDRNQRSAGKAAALGLVLGVRFALTPPTTAKARSVKGKARLDIWQSEGSFAGNRNALAVSAYRQCQKEQALQALNNFRWAR